MRFTSVTLSLIGLSNIALAAPQGKKPIPPKCTDFHIPISASAPVKLINPVSLPQNFEDPTVLEDFIVSEASSGLAALLGLAGTTTHSGKFQMSARYCEPAVKVVGRENTIQYLQHAITNTKDYWNGLAYPRGIDGSKYSWIDVASANGYPTIAVDNLGTGNSSHPDPVSVVQMSLQVEIIHGIIQKLRQGKVNGPVKGRKFNKVVYAGHSYGSICGNGLAATHPKDVDAFILTGYSGEFINGLGPLSAGLAIPASQVKQRFSDLAPGYLAQSVASGRTAGLYTTLNGNIGGFDPRVAKFDFKNEGTVALGELATLFYGVTPAEHFTGSVFALTGKQDAIVCNEPTGPNCGTGKTSKPAVAGKFFPNAKDYSYHIPNLTGHSANVHYSSPKSFQVAHRYLESQGF